MRGSSQKTQADLYILFSVGYVKTTSVKIDFDVLKNIQAPPGFDPEVYDDIDVISSETG